MDDTKIQNFIATISEQFIVLEEQIAELRASVTVLKGILAIQLSPDDPLEGAKQLRHLEDAVLKRDPNASARQQAADVIEAVRLWQKTGGGKHEA
jgi:hypothetical protein